MPCATSAPRGRKAIAIDPSYISKAGKKTLAVIKRYRKELLKLTDLVVADAFFSTRTFYELIVEDGKFPRWGEDLL